MQPTTEKKEEEEKREDAEGTKAETKGEENRPR